MEWLVEHLVTQYGLLGVLAAMPLAGCIWVARATSKTSRQNYHQIQRLSRQNSYLFELCLRLQERELSRTRETAERLAKAYASASPSTLQQLALDTESDFSVDMSDLYEDQSEQDPDTIPMTTRRFPRPPKPG